MYSGRAGVSPFVQTAEIYPLILSIGITIQGMGFALAQAQGLNGLLSRGCTIVSQFMLPGKLQEGAIPVREQG